MTDNATISNGVPMAKTTESKFKAPSQIKINRAVPQEQNDDDYWGRDITSPIPLADSARGIVIDQDGMTPATIPDTNAN